VLATFNFLQYGTTAQVARASGAGQDAIARKLGAQALWLSLAIGMVLAATIAVLATPIVSLVGFLCMALIAASLGETVSRGHDGPGEDQHGGQPAP